MPESTLSLCQVKSVDRAAHHPIVRDQPAVDFFEGALLGNGRLGAVVITRPDAVVIHFGHNNVWDIRIAEHSQETIGTFQEMFDRIKASPADLASLDEFDWYQEYRQTIEANYRKKPYPRPFPCGSLLLGFDRRQAELLGHRLDISTGLCEIHFLIEGKVAKLELFTDMSADRLWLRLVGANGDPKAAPFERIRLMPDPDTPPDMPDFETAADPTYNTLSFRQLLPFQEPHLYDPAIMHPKDCAFRLAVRTSDVFAPVTSQTERFLKTEFIDSFAATRDESRQPRARRLEQILKPGSAFVAYVQLDEGLASSIPPTAPQLPPPNQAAFESAAAASRRAWQDYWEQSGITIEDEFL